MKKFVLPAVLFFVLVGILTLLICIITGRNSSPAFRDTIEASQLKRIDSDGTVVYGTDLSGMLESEILASNEMGVLYYVHEQLANPPMTSGGETIDEAWEVRFWKIDRTGFGDETLIYDYSDFIHNGQLFALTSSYFCAYWADGTLMQVDLSCQFIRDTPRKVIDLKEIVPEGLVCRELWCDDGRTVRFRFDDGSGLRYDPVTTCLLSEKEAFPQDLPNNPEQIDPDDYEIHDGILLDHGTIVCDLKTALSYENIPEKYKEIGPGHLDQTYLDAEILGVTDRVILLKLTWICEWAPGSKPTELIMSECPRYDCAYYLLVRETCEVLYCDSKKYEHEQMFVIGNKVFKLGHDPVQGRNWNGTWPRYLLYQINTRDGIPSNDPGVDLYAVVGGNSAQTGAVLQYKDRLILAFEDGTIRSYDPVAKETQILSEDCGWIPSFGIDGDTLSWYAFLQHGGQLHTLNFDEP